jgi:acid stress-induced BolA-like protein IbaG/YrbA
MSPEEVKQLIEAGLPGCDVTVTGDGSHFDAIVVGEVFEGLSPVKKQQMVYGTVTDKITSGELHALTIKAYTPDEWATARKLQISS